MDSTLAKKAHWPPAYIYFQSAVLIGLILVMTHARYQDDSYITLTYARNLIEGHGLVWNPGEYVEGYSNFLYLMLIAGLGWLGMDLVIASNVVSFAGYAGIIATLLCFTRAHERAHAHSIHAYAHSINAALCISLTATSGIVLSWCWGGMEAVFFAFTVIVPVCFVLRWIRSGATPKLAFLTGICFALTAMTRPEGTLFGGLSGLFLTAAWLTKRLHQRVTFTQLALLAAGFLIIFVPYMGWRIWYFGEWLPNTVIAKTFGISHGVLLNYGIFYFLQFLLLPPFLLLIALCLFTSVLRRDLASPSLLYVALLIAAFCGTIISSGGDHMPYLRFFVPVIPLLSLGMYLMFDVLIPHREKLFRDLCGACLAFAVLQLAIIKEDDNLSRGALSGAAVAPYVTQHWPEHSLIGINPAGALPYFAPHYRYIDMLGLMDKTIARRDVTSPIIRQMTAPRPVGHLKGDGRYVLSRRPDYIVFGDAWGDGKARFLGDLELEASPEFHRLYTRVEHYIDVPAAISPAIEELAEQNKKDISQHPDNPDNVVGPILNEKNQLRFTYYQRKTSPAP